MSPEENKTLWAPVKWAQRKDSLYVTIDLPDVKNESVKLTNKSLTFAGSSNDQKYEVALEFFKEVDAEATESKWAKTDRNVQFYILKKDKDDAFWPRLLENKILEKTNITVDWNKYADEDDDNDQGGFDMSALAGGGGFDLNQMMAAQNADMDHGGEEDEEEEDSDDEEMPDLEANDKK